MNIEATRSVKKRNDLNDEERLHLFMVLLKEFDGKKLAHGSIKKFADQINLSCKTISRIWALGSNFLANGDVVDVSKIFQKMLVEEN